MFRFEDLPRYSICGEIDIWISGTKKLNHKQYHTNIPKEEVEERESIEEEWES